MSVIDSMAMSAPMPEQTLVVAKPTERLGERSRHCHGINYTYRSLAGGFECYGLFSSVMPGTLDLETRGSSGRTQLSGRSCNGVEYAVG
jgi:hypothetical protein